MSNPTNDQTTVVEAATGPTNSGYWTDSSSRYDISWYNNPDTATYGDGSAEKPYKISTAAQLAGLSYLVYSGTGPVTNTNYFFSGVYFEQTANIDLSAYYWQPIGIRYTREGTSRNNYFSGSYDGGNHTVSGIFTPAGSSNAYSFQGLFGRVYSSSSSYPVTIQNIGITNSFIQGYSYVGGVVGYAYASYGSITITNCYNTGAVSGAGDRVGGVVGYASSSSITITNCYNTGSVNGSSYVGGVAGNASGTISYCYNTGAVTGSSNVGGVVASAASNATITNCYYGAKCPLSVGGISGTNIPGQAEHDEFVQILRDNDIKVYYLEDLPEFRNAENLTSISGLCRNCKSLKYIEGLFNSAQVEDFSEAFLGCASIDDFPEAFDFSSHQAVSAAGICAIVVNGAGCEVVSYCGEGGVSRCGHL